MSVKGSKTTASFLDWDRALNAGRTLLKDKKSSVYGLYIIVSIHTGLRVSDVLELTYEQLREDTVDVTETKTDKTKTVAINKEIHKALNSFEGKSGKVFIGQKGFVLSKQQINRKLKQIFSREAKKQNISSHSLRKTFGRRVWNLDNQSDRALIMLSQMFNHTSTKNTRIYLGIQLEELNGIYLNL